MLKLYDIKWTTSRNQPESLHYPPGIHVLWCTHATNDNSREIGVFTTRVSTGFIAAQSVPHAVQIVMQEFPGSMISSVAEFDGLPFMPPDVTAQAWAIERYNYFANTGRLLPSSALLAGINGYTAATVFATPELPLPRCVERGIKYPYDERSLPLSTERRIALSILADLSDRRGIRQELYQVDGDVRIEIVDDLTMIVRSLLNK